MLRSRRCTECGNLFMSVDQSVCGTCRGETPMLVSDHDIEQITKATQAPPKAPQTVDIKALAGLSPAQGVTDIGPSPAPKRKRKSKAAPDGNA